MSALRKIRRRLWPRPNRTRIAERERIRRGLFTIRLRADSAWIASPGFGVGGNQG